MKLHNDKNDNNDNGTMPELSREGVKVETVAVAAVATTVAMRTADNNWNGRGR
jgi:hypothetical protein